MSYGEAWGLAGTGRIEEDYARERRTAEKREHSHGSQVAPIRVRLADGKEKVVRDATHVKVDAGALVFTCREGIVACFASGEWQSYAPDASGRERISE